jgi:hypothetical protein
LSSIEYDDDDDDDEEEEENLLPAFVSGNKIIGFCYRNLLVTKFRTAIFVVGAALVNLVNDFGAKF